MKHVAGIILLLFLSPRLSPQTDTSSITADSSLTIDSSSIVVHKDPRIDRLVKKQIEINEITTREARRFVPGYRILVVSTNNRNKAIEAKTKIYQEFPELKAYLIWQPPFFKLKVGNFKERPDADTYLEDIKRFFPTGVYIVRDIIEVNPDKSGELNLNQ